ncbi:MAG: histidinol-phosphate transaminase [Halobacteriaceae archaeon]
MQPRDLSDNVAYRAGRGIEEVARELGRDPEEFVVLSSNENPLGPSPAAADAVRAAADAVHRYPKASHADLTAAIADRWGVADVQVWLANGGDGALDYLARATLEPGDAVLVPAPGFAYYPMSARYHHGTVREYRLRRADEYALTADVVLDAYAGERVVYLTSPHNPTGGRFDLADVERVAAETADETLVVVDEAYAEFADAPSAAGLLADRDDVAVLRTFSKAHGLAGLRLGYALVPDEWADAYARVNTPFAASEVACRAGLAALEDDEHVERTVELARWGRTYLSAELHAPTFESHGNFVMAAVGEVEGVPDAATVADAAKREGVIVRDCTSFGLPDSVRVTTGTREDVRTAVDVLNGVLADVGSPAGEARTDGSTAATDR